MMMKLLVLLVLLVLVVMIVVGGLSHHRPRFVTPFRPCHHRRLGRVDRGVRRPRGGQGRG